MRRSLLAALVLTGCTAAAAGPPAVTTAPTATAPTAPPATAPPATGTAAVTTGTAAPAEPGRERPLLLVLEPVGDMFGAEQRTSIETAIELLLAERLAVDVQSSRGLRERMDLIGEKQLSGCDTSACVAEIASALGARFVVFSRAAKLGSDTLLRVELFDDTEARTLALSTVQAGDDKALLARLPKAVGELLDEAGPILPRRANARALVQTELLRGPSPLLVGGAVAAAAGAVVGVSGAVVAWLSAGASEDTVTASAATYAADPTLDNARAVRSARVATIPGPLQPVGQGGVALGLAGLVAGAVVVGIDLLQAPAATEEAR